MMAQECRVICTRVCQTYLTNVRWNYQQLAYADWFVFFLFVYFWFRAWFLRFLFDWCFHARSTQYKAHHISMPHEYQMQRILKARVHTTNLSWNVFENSFDVQFYDTKFIFDALSPSVVYNSLWKKKLMFIYIRTKTESKWCRFNWQSHEI